MGLLSGSRRLLADKKGNVLIIAAAAMPLLVGSAGLAIDTVQLSLMRRHLQRAADTGALAGAYARVQEKDVPAAVNRALGFSDAFPLASPAIIQNAPTSGSYANNDRAVRVVLEAQRSLPFWSFFSGTPPTISVEATAALVYTGKYCMVALDESAGTGITFSGNSTVSLGCGVISNTTGAQAVYADASADVTASPVAAVGGVPSSGAYIQPTLLLPYSLRQENPFQDIPEPTTPSSCQPAAFVENPGDTLNITPGCYDGFTIHGTLNLAPGTYYLTGDFTVNSQANVTGTGVTLIFTSMTPSDQGSYPNISINGSAELDLTAPTEGEYEGLLMQYDQRREGGDYFINGNSYSKFEGAFYFPKQHLTFNGNSEMETNCIQLVAYRLTFTGNTEITNTCPSSGGAKAFDATWVRLVG